MFGYTKRENSDTVGWMGSFRLHRAFNYGQESNIRCFVASYARDEGGVAKKWRMMTRGRGGVTIPPKIDDVIYEQPLMCKILRPQLV